MVTCTIGTRPRISFNGRSATGRGAVAGDSAGAWATPIVTVSRSNPGASVKLRENLMFPVDWVRSENFREKHALEVVICSKSKSPPLPVLDGRFALDGVSGA
jgi:hypothetical protein